MGDKGTPIWKLFKHDPELNPISTVAAVEDPFTPGTINAFTRLLLLHVTGDDRVVWMVNDKYEFHVVSAEGRLLRTIVKDYEPLKVTAADRKKILEERYGDAPYRSMIVFPDAYPPIYYFIGDAEGRLYAQTYETDARGGWLYDVFDQDGRCITRFALPREEMPFIVSKGMLYALIRENEEGLPLVKRYAMAWR